MDYTLEFLKWRSGQCKLKVLYKKLKDNGLEFLPSLVPGILSADEKEFYESSTHNQTAWINEMIKSLYQFYNEIKAPPGIINTQMWGAHRPYMTSSNGEENFLGMVKKVVHHNRYGSPLEMLGIRPTHSVHSCH